MIDVGSPTGGRSTRVRLPSDVRRHRTRVLLYPPRVRCRKKQAALLLRLTLLQCFTSAGASTKDVRVAFFAYDDVGRVHASGMRDGLFPLPSTVTRDEERSNVEGGPLRYPSRASRLRRPCRALSPQPSGWETPKASPLVVFWWPVRSRITDPIGSWPDGTSHWRNR